MYHTILGTENGKRFINNLVIKNFYAQLSVLVTQHEKVRFKRIPNLSTFSHYVAIYYIDFLRIFVCLLTANKTYCIQLATYELTCLQLSEHCLSRKSVPQGIYICIHTYTLQT